tara:strand:+ start:10740 stop:11582 length:843 start_codon:yes stop_codon:yes gene_type:complete
MKVGFISDFFSSQLTGGAELNDEVLITYLSRKFDLIKIASQNCTIQKLQELDYIIISNFIGLDSNNRDFIINNKPYLIYEHDHKYVSTRDPSKFKDFKIPEQNLINLSFYKSAKKVICLSSIQVKILEESAKLNNCVSIGTSLWHPSSLQYIKDLDKTKNNKVAIVNSNNPIKNTPMAKQFCTSKQMDFDLISAPDSKQFLKILSQYETLVFFPGVLESLCRLVVEAKMLNCKVITKKRLLGASYEDWFHLSGDELIEKISEKVYNALLLFENTILENKK